MNLGALALLATIALVGGEAAADVAADVDADADRAFREATQRAVAGDAGAIAAFEALGAERPVTQWTQHAWAEVARLAERTGDLPRARRALDQVITLGTDQALVERARVAQAGLAAQTAGGQWDAVAVEHDRLVEVIRGGSDPRAALGELEALVRANPRYPRTALARRAIARGWEEEGDRDRAMTWLREDAVADLGLRMHLDLARMLVRDGALDEAEAVVRSASVRPGADVPAFRDVLASIEEAERRRWRRAGLWAVLGLLALGAAGSLRRTTGSWKVAARRFVRPPIEVVFLVPVAVLVIVVAETGNPLVARAVRSIVIAGVLVAWISGTLLDAVRARGSLGIARTAVQAVLAVLAVAITAYLALDRDRVVELLLETWRGGHALR